MQRLLFLLLNALFCLLLGNAFAPLDRASSCTRTRHQHYYMVAVDPQVLNSLGVLVSPAEMTTLVAAAVAGAVSQQPRIQQLEQELGNARTALNETQVAMNLKMTQLQDKLFEMDVEYEAQTARFKKQYDTKLQQDLKQQVAKLKQDYEFKLNIAVEQQKSALLSKQLHEINGGMTREAQLSSMRIQQEQLTNTNLKLEQALEESQQELERMRQAASIRPKVFGIF